MLDQRAEETLHGAIEGAVHHQRLLAGAVFRNILELKALRQVEVELHGGKLPWPANGIHQLDVNLGAIKCGLAGNGFIGNAAPLERTLQRIDSEFPFVISAQEIFLVIGVPDAQLNIELVKAKCFEHGQCKIDASDNLVFDLLGSAEDVRIILSE